MPAYYNEIDPFAAQWLRNLVAAGHIAPGDVDSRSIVEVQPDDLKNYTQCHFFAGIGVWSYALRRAGWSDDHPVWTGSCPCQPFSAAGKNEGTADPRHLWPEWFRLIRECRPVAIFGEQVSAAIRHGWLDLVSADLEGAGYAIGAAVLGAHSVGAPHIRQRLYFVAHAQHDGHHRPHRIASEQDSYEQGERLLVGDREPRQLADSKQRAAERHGFALDAEARGVQGEVEQQRIRNDAWDGGNSGVALGDTDDARPQGRGVSGADRGRHSAGECVAGEAGSADGVGDASVGRRESRQRHGRVRDADDEQRNAAIEQRAKGAPHFWSSCDWLPCIDGKARPVEPGTFPLAHGAAARVGRLRAYGNAIVAPAAEEFIRAYLSR